MQNETCNDNSWKIFYISNLLSKQLKCTSRIPNALFLSTLLSKQLKCTSRILNALLAVTLTLQNALLKIVSEHNAASKLKGFINYKNKWIGPSSTSGLIRQFSITFHGFDRISPFFTCVYSEVLLKLRQLPASSFKETQLRRQGKQEVLV